MTLEGIFVGDIHFDKLDNLFEAAHLDLQEHEIRKALDFAVQNGILHVWFGGDVCERARLSEEAKITFLRILKDYDGRLIMRIILGNHDFAMEGYHSLQLFVEMCRFGMFKTVHIYDKPVQEEIDGVTVNFLPYPYFKPLPSKRPCVNIAHLEVKGAVRDNGMRIKKSENRINDEEKDVWLVGHLHTPQTIGRVFYPGTLYQLNFGESLPKGFLHFRFKYNGKKLMHKIDFMENDPQFKLFNIVVERQKDLSKIDPNPLYLHKLFVQAKIKLPPTFLEDHPNVVNRISFDNEEELQVLKANEPIIELGENKIGDFSVKENLPQLLKAKGATDRQVARALEIVDNIGIKHGNPA